MFHRKHIHVIDHVFWQPYWFFLFKPSKIFFSEIAEPVITASSYKVAVLIVSLINDITHQYTNTTQNKSWRGSAISDRSFSLLQYEYPPLDERSDSEGSRQQMV